MHSVKARGKCNHPERGVCQVKGGKMMPWCNYWVLDTDYDDFAIVYSKVTGFMKHFVTMEFLWVLTRAPYEQDTQEWKEIKAKTDELIKKKLPSFDLGRLRPTL